MGDEVRHRERLGSLSGKVNARIVQLDFLRGIAILLVLGQHLRVWPGEVPPELAGRLRPVAVFLDTFGWTGVDLFFVLSGFLIGGLLFGEIRSKGSLDVKRFLVRRGFKIWPLYYLCLIAVIVYLARSVPLLFLLRNMLFQFCHLQNYFEPRITPLRLLSPTWSLAVEEHFYLCLPLLLLILIRFSGNAARRLPALPVLALGVMAFCLYARFRLLGTDRDYLHPTHLRMDSLFFGVLLAYGWHYHQERLQRWLKWPAAWLVAGLLLVSPMFTRPAGDPFAHTAGFTLLSLGYGCILLALMATYLPEGKHTRLAAFFTTRLARAVAYIGFFSYPIYLFHLFPGKLPLAWLLRHYPLTGASGTRWLLLTGLYVASAITIGAVLSKLIEVPTLALRDRLFPALSNKAAVASRPEAPAAATVS